MLIPPKSAPPRVKAVIAAANKIRTKPYIYGGGHGRWWDRGYDCSGSVSYALHGGEFLDSPLPSGPMASWGLAGEGRWITVYANAGHAYAVIAGYRWDTSGNTDGKTGPQLARGPARQRRLRRPPPGRLLALRAHASGARTPPRPTGRGEFVLAFLNRSDNFGV